MSEEQPTTEVPLVERPDEHEVGTELYCWLPSNDDRECNGSCVAFEPASLTDDRVDTCKFLNTVRSIAMSVGLLSKAARTNQTKQEVAARKAVADALPPPPEVK